MVGPMLELAKGLDKAIATLSRPQLEVKVKAEPPEGGPTALVSLEPLDEPREHRAHAARHPLGRRELAR